MLKELREQVFKANLELVERGLVILTWGNASGFDPESGYVVIKPSGVDSREMTPENMVIVDLDGKVVEGKLKPSSDASTHLELYRKFKGIKGVVHTHSRYATAWAQAGKEIPALGTTHADYFYGNIPCTRGMTNMEVATDYELNTGLVICEHFENIDFRSMPAVLVKNHGPFCWGESPAKAVENAFVLEEVAIIASITSSLGTERSIDKFLLDKHYLRKHGKDSYYGQ